jgi:hypothetical protein
MTGLKKGIEMKPIQILVLATALGAAAGAQNINPNAGKPSPTPTPAMKVPQKGAAATPPAKPAPATPGPSQNSGPKLIVPPKPGEKMAGSKTADAKAAGAQTAGAHTAGAKTGMPASTPAHSIQTGGAKPANPKTSAAQMPSAKAANAKATDAKTSAVPQKTPVLPVKPGSKPAVNAKTTTPSTTPALKKNAADNGMLRKKKEEPPVKIVPQQKASNGKPGTEPAPSGPAGRRDPFLSIIRSTPSGPTVTGSNCSVGKRCLYIPDLELKGIVRDTEGQWMAVVVNNNRRAYFLRENDQVFNGSVQKITTDSVVFREFAVDHLGRETQHEVVKRLPKT